MKYRSRGKPQLGRDSSFFPDFFPHATVDTKEWHGSHAVCGFDQSSAQMLTCHSATSERELMVNQVNISSHRGEHLVLYMTCFIVDLLSSHDFKMPVIPAGPKFGAKVLSFHVKMTRVHVLRSALELKSTGSVLCRTIM